VHELRVRLLGGIAVDGLASHEVGSRKGRALLGALALARGRPTPVDRLVEVLWPDGLPARPADQVGVLVSRLRGVLGADRLERTTGGYALAYDWLDLAALEELVEEAASRLRTVPAASRAAASAALALVRGPLLPDVEGDWVAPERAAADRLVARAHLLGAEAALAVGDHGAAAAGASRALDVDPFDEASLRVLMRAHVAAGRPSSALGAYARTREVLAEELGASPDPATEALHTAILRADEDRSAVVGGSGGAGPDALTLGPPVGGLVGRRDERAWLDRQLDAVRAGAGAGRLVVVEGEAGIGKTSLVRAWAGGLADVFVLATACDELGRDLPLQPVLDGLDAHLATLPADEVDAVLGHQRPIVGPLLVTATRGSEAPAPGATRLPDPGAQRAVLFTALLAVVERAARGRPVVLVVDDAHLAGEVTVAWLRHAVRRGRRVLVVAARRPGPSGLVHTGVRLDLGPLDLGAAEVLVGAARAAELHGRCGGHPLFLLALAHADPAADGLPASITEVVDQQLDALGSAGPTVRAAAVLGPHVDLSLLADVLDRAPVLLLDDLEAAARARLLVDGTQGFVFAHELVREAIALPVSAPRRALLHREAARALDRRAGAEPLAVAHHARRGGDLALAAGALVTAARSSADRGDHAGAVGLLDDAVALADGAPARLARAHCRLVLRDFDGAAADVEAAIGLGAGAAGFELAGWVHYYRRDFPAARRYAEEGVARADDDPHLRASCLSLVGRLLHADGDLTGAEARLTAADAEAPPALRPLTRTWLGDLRVFQGRWREAADHAERALLDTGRLTHPFALPHARITRLRAAAIAGRVGVALATSDRLLSEVEGSGELGARYVPAACNYRAWILRHLGRGGEADELNERARSLTSSAGAEEPYNQGTLDLADGRLLAGDPDGAARHLAALRGLDTDGPADERSADDVSGGGPPEPHEMPAMAWHQYERLAVLRARVALLRGDADSAAAIAGRLAATAGARGSARHAAIGRVLEAQAHQLLGDPLDPAEVESRLVRLDDLAGLEAWRLTAELARAPAPVLGSELVPELAAAAGRRAAALLAATPAEHRPGLEAWMAAWLR
jgi:DNA-binding SARP family transcriptional activator